MGVTSGGGGGTRWAPDSADAAADHPHGTSVATSTHIVHISRRISIEKLLGSPDKSAGLHNNG